MILRTLGSSSLLGVAVLYGTLLRLAGATGAIGFALGIIFVLSLWRYAYAVLRAMAQGRTRLPVPDAETVIPIGGGFALHFMLFAPLAFFFATTPLLGDGLTARALRLIGFAAVLGVFPASAALLGLSSSIGASVNPANIAGVIATLGRRYAALLLAWAGLATFAVFGPRLLAPERAFLGLLVTDIIVAWALLAAFALIGAALREHRADFDIPGERDDEERRERDRDRDWQKALDRAYGSIRSGLVGEGYRMIRELLSSQNDSLEVYQWVFNRMLTWEDKTHALLIAGKLVERLIEERFEHGALELVAQCRRLKPDFAVAPNTAQRLADYARRIGRHGVADELAALNPRVPTP